MAERSSIPGLPSLADEADDAEPTELRAQPTIATSKHAYLLRLSGQRAGLAHRLAEDGTTTVGRGSRTTVRIEDGDVSREHARIRRVGVEYFLEDATSANGTQLNGMLLSGPALLTDGDRIRLGTETVLKFTFFDEVEARYHAHAHDAVARGDGAPLSARTPVREWSPSSWRTKPMAQAVVYRDQDRLREVLAKLKALPPLVTSWEVEELKALIADAQMGHRFLLQGGDCAETHAECDSPTLTNKLKIMTQMSLVLTRGLRRPVVRVGRFAGQYAKPRSKPTETRDGVTLPSYFGDLVNRPAFTPEAREPDPDLLLASYYHAGLTLNYIRAITAGDFADLRRPEYLDMSFGAAAGHDGRLGAANLPSPLMGEYQRMSRELSEGLAFMRSLGERAFEESMRVKFYASHEGLSLEYEEAQTRLPPRRDRHYDLTTHLPWIGERTRQLDGAHIDFFRGIANPIGVKIGPTATKEEVIDLCRVLNPANEPGKLVLVARMGAGNVQARLPNLVNAVRRASLRVLWVCDPMHGNAITTRDNIKTRDFEAILSEVSDSIEIHRAHGSYLGGVHFELTGDDVTECIGGGLTEADLTHRYATLCDPRLNYRQAIQMAFLLAQQLGRLPAAPSIAPPPPSRR